MIAIGLLLLVAAAAIAYQPGLQGQADASANPGTGVSLPPGARSLEIHVALEAPADAAARTWPFEVRDADGEVLETVQVSLSGDAPSATVRVEAIPAGADGVSLRPTPDVAGSCAGAAWFALDGGVAMEEAHAVASFTVEICDSAR